VKNLIAEYPDITYLDDEGYEYMGLKFWGSPIQPWFHDWAFNRLRGEKIKAHWDLIPLDTDILITHGPPRGLGDRILPTFERYNENPNVGCDDLLAKVLEVKPKVNVFGHIHEGYCEYTHPVVEKRFINASSLNANYEPINAPIIIDIEV